MNFAENVQSQFNALVSRAGADEKRYRQLAWDHYARLGLPERRTEAWKYSSINSLVKQPWELAGADKPVPMEVVRFAEKWQEQFDTLIVLDGVMRPEVSTLSKVKGVLWSPVQWDVLAHEMGEVQKRSTAILSTAQSKPNNQLEAASPFADGWTALSAALAKPGVQLLVGDDVKLPKPVLIIHAQSEGALWAPSVNQFILGARAEVSLAEIFAGAPGRYLRSSLTEVDLREHAQMNWVRVQQEDNVAGLHFSETRITMEKAAQLSLTQLNGGSVWSRGSIRAEIRGEGAGAHLNGLTFARAQQHIDQRVEVRHMAGNSESSQLFKGVLKDRARGIVNGKIYIAKDAQKVSSLQMNHNLLLSPGAEADTKPELEVYADDVKANHGASIGRLDEDKMFYLMSRGIPRTLAQQMLAHAFVGDVLMKIPRGPLVEFAEDCVRGWLPEFSHDMEVHA